MLPSKKFTKKDSHDPQYMKLGNTEDARKQRADAIERERRQNCITFATTIIIVIVTILSSVFL